MPRNAAPISEKLTADQYHDHAIRVEEQSCAAYAAGDEWTAFERARKGEYYRALWKELRTR